MPTVVEIVEESRHLISRVPPLELWQTCYECLGPVDGYRRCYSCNQLFSETPDELSGTTVPMSVVVNPSPWYSRLKGYKAGNAREYRPVLASVAYWYLQENEDGIAALLGGPAEMIAVTPSKGRHAGGTHPLRSTIELVEPALLPIAEPVRYVGDGSERRGQYRPDDYEADAGTVGGVRIILLEDIWVSGGTCVSAAGALLESGAEAVAILPVARLVYTDPPVLVGADHPFFTAIEARFDPGHWPR